MQVEENQSSDKETAVNLLHLMAKSPDFPLLIKVLELFSNLLTVDGQKFKARANIPEESEGWAANTYYKGVYDAYISVRDGVDEIIDGMNSVRKEENDDEKPNSPS
jgi:hypothetical protein